VTKSEISICVAAATAYHRLFLTQHLKRTDHEIFFICYFDAEIFELTSSAVGSLSDCRLDGAVGVNVGRGGGTGRVYVDDSAICCEEELDGFDDGVDGNEEFGFDYINCDFLERDVCGKHKIC
jgi:hypothetical protein